MTDEHVHSATCFEGRTLTCAVGYSLDPETGSPIITPEIAVARAEAEARADREADARRDRRCIFNPTHAVHEGACEPPDSTEDL